MVEFRVAPINHWRSEGHRLDRHALLVHVGDALFQVNEFGRDRSYGIGRERRLVEETLARHAVFRVEALAIFVEEIQVRFWIIVAMDVYAAHARRAQPLAFRALRLALRDRVAHATSAQRAHRGSG